MATSNMKVLSYNVQMRPVADAPHHSIRAGKIPAEILKNNYDVIVFQEAFSDPERNKLVRGLRGTYPHVSQVLGGGDSLTRQDGGVIILSKYQILSYKEKIFKNGSLPDTLTKKGVAHVQIVKDKIRYHILGTHLQAGSSRGDKADREAQLADIRSLIVRIDPEDPALIVGDLNINYGSGNQEYKLMLDILDANFPDQKLGHPYTSDPQNNPFHKDHPGGKQQFLDYVLYSKTNLIPQQSSLTTRIFRTSEYWGIKDSSLTLHKDLSDHYAVEGDFNFKVPPRKDSSKFPGYWQRVKVNGKEEPKGPVVQFNANRTYIAENPGGPTLKGYIHQITPGKATTGKLKVFDNTLKRFLEYQYAFRKNPALNIYFEPQGNKPWQQVPYRMNELVLKSPGLEQTYAFFRFLENWGPPPAVERP